MIVPQIRLGQSFHLTVFKMKVRTWAGPGNTGTLPVRRPTPPSLQTSSLFDRWCRAKINRGCVEERYRRIHRDIGCLRHKTSLMTQRVYSITLRMGRDRIKLAGVPEFPTSRSRLRTRAPTDQTWRDSAFPSVFSTQTLSMAYVLSLLLLCVLASRTVRSKIRSVRKNAGLSFPLRYSTRWSPASDLWSPGTPTNRVRRVSFNFCPGWFKWNILGEDARLKHVRIWCLCTSIICDIIRMTWTYCPMIRSISTCEVHRPAGQMPYRLFQSCFHIWVLWKRLSRIERSQNIEFLL